MDGRPHPPTAPRWVEALDSSGRPGGAFLRLSLTDGSEPERHTTPGPAALVATPEGPLLVPMPAGYGERAWSLFRHGPHAVFRHLPRPACACDCPADDDEDCACGCDCPECNFVDEEAWSTVADADRTTAPTHLARPGTERLGLLPAFPPLRPSRPCAPDGRRVHPLGAAGTADRRSLGGGQADQGSVLSGRAARGRVTQAAQGPPAGEEAVQACHKIRFRAGSWVS